MNSTNLSKIIQDQTERALWEVGNIINSVPDELWNKEYCESPMWKHIYHMLHSLDLWFINPRDKNFVEPDIHVDNLNDIDTKSSKTLSKNDMVLYYKDIKEKIAIYVSQLDDAELLLFPMDCEYNKFTLILAQFRHLHSHMGMIMGFIIDDTGLWPRVIGLENPIPTQTYTKYF